MKQLTETETQAIMQSDMKLWEVAETKHPTNTSIEKSIELPYGIGETTITLEGIIDAGTKKGAVASYGQYIRSLIKDRTDDEAVEARAKQAAARAEQRDIENGIYVGEQGVSDSSPAEAPIQGATQAHQEHVEEPLGFGEALIAQRAVLRDKVNSARADLARWSKELKALDAACAALEEEDDDAPTDTKTPEQSPA